MSYRLIDANALNNKISTEDYEIIMKEPELFADIPNGLDGGFYIAVPAHEGMTNGDMVKAVIPFVSIATDGAYVHIEVQTEKGIASAGFEMAWWNAPYKGTEE